MIIWSGYGFLAALIPFAFFFLASALTPASGGAVSGTTHNWPGAIALLLSAVAVWMIGTRLNSTPGRELIDPQTGQSVRFRRTHSLFFIPMQYTAVLAVIAAVIVLMAQPAAQP